MSDCDSILAAISALENSTSSLKSQLGDVQNKLDRLEQQVKPLPDLIGSIKGSVDNILPTITRQIDRILSELYNLINGLARTDDINKLAADIKETFQALSEIITSTTTSLKDVIISAINGLRDVLIQLIQSLLGDGKEDIDYERIANIVSNVVSNLLSSAISNINSNVNAQVQRAIDEIVRRLDSIDFNAKLDEVLSQLTNLVNAVARVIEAIGDLKNTIADIVQGAIKDAIQGLTQVLIQLIKSLFGDGNKDIDYDRIVSIVNTAHNGTQQVILNTLGTQLSAGFQNIEQLVKSLCRFESYTEQLERIYQAVINLKLEVDYRAIEKIIIGAHIETRNYISNAIQAINIAQILSQLQVILSAIFNIDIPKYDDKFDELERDIDNLEITIVDSCNNDGSDSNDNNLDPIVRRIEKFREDTIDRFSQIEEYIKDQDYNIDVINQVNVDTAPLAEIVVDIRNAIELSNNNIVNGVLVGIGGVVNVQGILLAIARLEAKFDIQPVLNAIANIKLDVDFKPVLDLVNNVENNIEVHIGEIVDDIKGELAEVDFNVDVINQVNVDTSLLAEIVLDINNAIELSNNNIVNGILVGIAGILQVNPELNVDLQPVLNAVAELKAELNLDVNLQPVLELVNNIDAKLDVNFNYIKNELNVRPKFNIDFNPVFEYVNEQVNNKIITEIGDIELSLSQQISNIKNNLIFDVEFNYIKDEVINSIVTNNNSLEFALTNTVNNKYEQLVNSFESKLAIELRNQINNSIVATNTVDIKNSIGDITLTLNSTKECCDKLAKDSDSNLNIRGLIVSKTNCNGTVQIYNYSGNGLLGIQEQINKVANQIEDVKTIICDGVTVIGDGDNDNNDGCFVLRPDDNYAELKVERQLVIQFGRNYPKVTGSIWDIHIPNPIDDLDWCKHLDDLVWRRGSVVGRGYFENSAIYTGGYFETEDIAFDFINKIALLSKNELTNGRPRITKHGSPKQQPVIQTIRAVRAVIATLDDEGNTVDTVCYKPPKGGC